MMRNFASCVPLEAVDTVSLNAAAREDLSLERGNVLVVPPVADCQGPSYRTVDCHSASSTSACMLSDAIRHDRFTSSTRFVLPAWVRRLGGMNEDAWHSIGYHYTHPAAKTNPRLLQVCIPRRHRCQMAWRLLQGPSPINAVYAGTLNGSQRKLTMPYELKSWPHSLCSVQTWSRTGTDLGRKQSDKAGNRGYAIRT
jgi:hypothetical protein